MDTLSGQDKFLYNSDGFHVIIPNPTSDGQPYLLYDRVRVTDLRPHVLPEPRFTRGGHLSSHQPEPVEEQPYTFYLAQLIHYGLEFEWSKGAAKLSLAKAIENGSLRVPPLILHLEKYLRQLWEEKPRDAIRVGDTPVEESPDVIEGYISPETEDTDWTSEEVWDELVDKSDDEDVTNEEDGEGTEERKYEITEDDEDYDGDLAVRPTHQQREVSEDTSLTDEELGSDSRVGNVDKDTDPSSSPNGTEAEEDDATSMIPGQPELSEEEDLDADATLKTFLQSKTVTSTAPRSSKPAGTVLRVSDDIQPKPNVITNPFLIPGESSRVLGTKRKYVPPKKSISQISVVITTSDSQVSKSPRPRPEAATGDEIGQQIDACSSSRKFYEEITASKVTKRSKTTAGPRSGNQSRAPFQSTVSKVPKTARELNGVLHGQYSHGVGSNYGDNHADDSEWAEWDRPVAKHRKSKY